MVSNPLRSYFTEARHAASVQQAARLYRLLHLLHILVSAPVTPWQHCLDEGTKCYYYWNTVTNEVTWEIPPDYSQYMLLFKEFEEAYSHYEAELAQRAKAPKKMIRVLKKK